MKKIFGKLVLVGLFFLLFGFTNVYAEEMINDVSITGMIKPEIGETVADNIANIKIPEGANYTIEEIIWWGSEDGMYYYDMADDSQFEEGIYYYCSVTLRANDGYDFPVDEEGYDYTGNLSTSELGYEFAQQYEPGLLDVFGEYFVLSTEEETPAETPAETPNEIAPPNTGVVATNNNEIIYVSILGLSITGLFLKKKIFNK